MEEERREAAGQQLPASRCEEGPATWQSNSAAAPPPPPPPLPPPPPPSPPPPAPPPPAPSPPPPLSLLPVRARCRCARQRCGAAQSALPSHEAATPATEGDACGRYTEIHGHGRCVEMEMHGHGDEWEMQVMRMVTGILQIARRTLSTRKQRSTFSAGSISERNMERTGGEGGKRRCERWEERRWETVGDGGRR